MKIIVGLGNPGKDYENTKHNVGFLTIDILAEKLGIKVNKIKFKALVGEGFAGGQKVILVKPQTYMNLSGNSVREVLAFYKADIEDMLVIYDDIDLPMGNLRLRPKGSAGTHNGMRSIVYDIADDGFPRLRIGIGGERKGDLANYVLGGFRGDDKDKIEAALIKAADACACFIEHDLNKAMVEYNTKKPKPEKKKKEKAAAETAAVTSDPAAGGTQPSGEAASAAEPAAASEKAQVKAAESVPAKENDQ